MIPYLPLSPKCISPLSSPLLFSPHSSSSPPHISHFPLYSSVNMEECYLPRRGNSMGHGEAGRNATPHLFWGGGGGSGTEGGRSWSGRAQEAKPLNPCDILAPTPRQSRWAAGAKKGRLEEAEIDKDRQTSRCWINKRTDIFKKPSLRSDELLV